MANPSIFPPSRQLPLRLHNRHLPPYIAITEGNTGITPRLPMGSIVILRGYDLADREQRALQLAALCRKKRWKLLVGGDPQLAAKVRASGLHIPEWAAFHLAVWRKRRPHWLITLAAHIPSTVVQAARLGMDAALYSPLFPTSSHPGEKTLGATLFSRLTHKSPVAVYALGGVNGSTILQLRPCRIAGVAALEMFREER